jgi:hypothetical protein
MNLINTINDPCNSFVGAGLTSSAGTSSGRLPETPPRASTQQRHPPALAAAPVTVPAASMWLRNSFLVATATVLLVTALASQAVASPVHPALLELFRPVAPSLGAPEEVVGRTHTRRLHQTFEEPECAFARQPACAPMPAHNWHPLAHTLTHTHTHCFGGCTHCPQPPSPLMDLALDLVAGSKGVVYSITLQSTSTMCVTPHWTEFKQQLPPLPPCLMLMCTCSLSDVDVHMCIHTFSQLRTYACIPLLADPRR